MPTPPDRIIGICPLEPEIIHEHVLAFQAPTDSPRVAYTCLRPPRRILAGWITPDTSGSVGDRTRHDVAGTEALLVENARLRGELAAVLREPLEWRVFDRAMWEAWRFKARALLARHVGEVRTCTG